MVKGSVGEGAMEVEERLITAPRHSESIPDLDAAASERPFKQARAQETVSQVRGGPSLWDSFWHKHGSGGGLFDAVLWRVRHLFARRHANLLLRHCRHFAVPGNPSFRLLEIGCGSATTTSYLSRAEPGAKVFAIDLSERAIRVARDRNPGLKCVVANAMALPFAPQRFSLAFSSGVLEHFDRSIARTMLQEHCRVTRFGGTVAVMVPNKRSLYNLLRTLCGKRWPFGHENPFRKRELRNLMEQEDIRNLALRGVLGTTFIAMGIKRQGQAIRHSPVAIRSSGFVGQPGVGRASRGVGARASTIPSPMGESRLFKAALSVNMAVRRSRLGPSIARLAYWLWDRAWDVALGFRGLFRGYVATFEVQGMKMRMDLRDRCVARLLFGFGEYEPADTRLLISLLKPGMTFIDVGANSGYYTILAAKAVGEDGRVMAFEPSPLNAELLRRNVALNGLRNVWIEEKAVASRHSMRRLHLSRINSGDHRLHNAKDDAFYNAGRERASIAVDATTLDIALLEHGGRADVIKLDIQGAEGEALHGMKRTLTRNRNVVLMTEYWPYGLRKSGMHPIHFLRELDALGFLIYGRPANGGIEIRSPETLHAQVTGVDSMTLFLSRNPLQLRDMD
ncbi:MAG: FkbM family methyltransferase [Anaerolineales bacterium]|jgi:FkbM family methyltransferase